MNTKTTSIVLIIVLIILGLWYWSSKDSVPAPVVVPEVSTNSTNTVNTNTETSNTNTETSFAPVVSLTTDSLGKHLVAANGMTLYRFTKDTSSKSTCYDDCADNWPPYTVAANQSLATKGDITGTLATSAREDMTTQLTYKGVPLYFYAGDSKPGDTNGQNVGKVWFVVNP